jgi:hypothetical protein
MAGIFMIFSPNRGSGHQIGSEQTVHPERRISRNSHARICGLSSCLTCTWIFLENKRKAAEKSKILPMSVFKILSNIALIHREL